MHSQPRWPLWFAYLQLCYGLPLLIFGVLIAMADERQWRLLVNSGFPFFTLASIHLSLAWTWYKRNALLWLPLLASLVAWPVTPIWLWQVPHLPLSAKGPVGSIGIGAVPAHILLIVIAVFIAILCLYILQCATALYVFIYRKSWFSQTSPLIRYSLGNVLVISAVLPTAIGLDWSIPAKRMRAQAQSLEAISEAPQRATNEYIEAVLAEDQQAIAKKLKACLGSEAFLRTLGHPDGRVRSASVHALAAPNVGRLYNEEMVALLGVVADRNETNDLRREALKAIAIKGDPNAVAGIHQALSQIAADNPFVAEELIAVISRDSPALGGLEPPTNALHILGTIGPDASAAVPALIDALDHKNQWTFATAAANALGSIGPAAESAIPVLERKASQRGYENLQVASQLAIKKIQAGQP